MADAGWVTTFEAYASGIFRSYAAPGFVLGVAEAGAPIYERGFGFRDVSQDLPATPDTVFGVGSITKSFTALAILQLQERGKLSVHDPVSRHLPELRLPGGAPPAGITLHHFLTHTAGLPPLGTLFAVMAPSMRGDPAVKDLPAGVGDTPLVTYEDLMAAIGRAAFEPLGEPGSHFSYSNDAYALLGAVIERASGERYQDYVRAHILQPAGMTRSGFDLEALPAGTEITTLYAAREKAGIEAVFAAPRWWEGACMVPAGFLRSTVRDLLRYLEVFRTGGRVDGRRIADAESVAQMTAPQVQAMPGVHYGYGLMITPDYRGVRVIEHGGAIKGVAAQITLIPDLGLTGAALTNLAGVPSEQLLLGALNARMGLPPDTRRLTLTDHVCRPERLPDYAGRYVSAEGAALTVSACEGRLRVENEGKRYTARPVGEDAFAVRVKENELYLRFARGPFGRVEAVHAGLRVIRRAADEPAAAGA